MTEQDYIEHAHRIRLGVEKAERERQERKQYKREVNNAFIAITDRYVPNAWSIIGMGALLGVVIGLNIWLFASSADRPPIGVPILVGAVFGAILGGGVVLSLTRWALWVSMRDRLPEWLGLWQPVVAATIAIPILALLFGLISSADDLGRAVAWGAGIGIAASIAFFIFATNQAALMAANGIE